MGIERLTSSLLLEANTEADQIIKAAETHVQKMVAGERAKTEELIKETHESVSKVLESRRNERIAWARLEAKRLLAEAKEDAIKNILEQFFEVLGQMKKSKEYRDFMSNGINYAIHELGNSGLTIHVSKGESKLVPRVKGIKVVEDLTALGGALVETKDHKVCINLTLEMVFESKKDELRKRIADKLFGGK